MFCGFVWECIYTVLSNMFYKSDRRRVLVGLSAQWQNRPRVGGLALTHLDIFTRNPPKPTKNPIDVRPSCWTLMELA